MSAELEAAEFALRAGIPVAAVLPFDDPAARWPEADRERFDQALRRSEWSLTLAGDPGRPGDAVIARNDWLAGQAAGVVVVDDEVLADRLAARAGDDLSMIRID